MKKILIFVLIMFVCNSLFAKEYERTFEERMKGVVFTSGYGITSGIAMSIGYQPFYNHKNEVLKTFALRIEGNYLNSLRISEDMINGIIQRRTATSLDFSKGDIHFSHDSFGFIADIYPFKRVFRITGGFYYNHSVLHGRVDINGDVTIGNTLYNVPDGYSVDGAVNFSKKIAPYIAVGMDSEIVNNLFLTAELGFMLASYPEVILDVNGPAGQIVSSEDLEMEEAWIESKVKVLRSIPVLRVGMAYKF